MALKSKINDSSFCQNINPFCHCDIFLPASHRTHSNGAHYVHLSGNEEQLSSYLCVELYVAWTIKIAQYISVCVIHSHMSVPLFPARSHYFSAANSYRLC